MGRIKRLWKDRRGAGVVEVLLILVVILALVMICRTQLMALITRIFESVNAKAGALY